MTKAALLVLALVFAVGQTVTASDCRCAAGCLTPGSPCPASAPVENGCCPEEAPSPASACSHVEPSSEIVPADAPSPVPVVSEPFDPPAVDVRPAGPPARTPSRPTATGDPPLWLAHLALRL